MPKEMHAPLMDGERLVQLCDTSKPAAITAVWSVGEVEHITCARCLKILAEKAVAKLRQLGMNLSPDNAHHCPATISTIQALESVRAQLAWEKELSSTQATEINRLRKAFEVFRSGKRPVLTPLEDSIPEPKKPNIEQSGDDDPTTKRFSLLEIDDD